MTCAVLRPNPVAFLRPPPLYFSHFLLSEMSILNVIRKRASLNEVSDLQKKSDNYCQAKYKDSKECRLQLFKLLDVREGVKNFST